MPSRLATIPQRKNEQRFHHEKSSGRGNSSRVLSAKGTSTLQECLSNAYFSRKMTSPWPTSWSFNHKRYL